MASAGYRDAGCHHHQVGGNQFAVLESGPHTRPDSAGDQFGGLLLEREP